ncbi:MAG: hypothetical protein HOG97_01600 [Candidatus Marinimicrobia bacterium]|jgi:hypothetical protein|nr:hypothetical protein [Candidatus Neomarinimicrobiota bacterium]
MRKIIDLSDIRAVRYDGSLDPDSLIVNGTNVWASSQYSASSQYAVPGTGWMTANKGTTTKTMTFANSQELIPQKDGIYRVAWSMSGVTYGNTPSSISGNFVQTVSVSATLMSGGVAVGAGFSYQASRGVPGGSFSSSQNNTCEYNGLKVDGYFVSFTHGGTQSCYGKVQMNATIY